MNRDELWADLENWGRDPVLSELDALMWRTDRHPEGAWSGVVILMLDRVPDWERLRAAHEWFVEIVPRFAQRVVDPVIPVGTPMWEDDPSFDLDFHLRRVSLPAPGTHRQLLELAQTIGLTPLDRSRPPWEGYLVEGLEGDRAAYVVHAHHVFMDGLALARLHERVLNVGREHQPDKPVPVRAPERHGPLGVTAQQLGRQIAGTPKALFQGGRALTNAALHLRSTADYVSSLARVAGPPPKNPSKILRGGPRRMWRFGTMECEFQHLRRAAKAAGGTLNDACGSRRPRRQRFRRSLLPRTVGRRGPQGAHPCDARTGGPCAIRARARLPGGHHPDPQPDTLGCGRGDSRVCRRGGAHDELMAGDHRGPLYRRCALRPDVRVRSATRHGSNLRDVYALRGVLYRDERRRRSVRRPRSAMELDAGRSRRDPRTRIGRVSTPGGFGRTRRGPMPLRRFSSSRRSHRRR